VVVARLGRVGLAAGFLFAAMSVWEHAAGYTSPRGHGVAGAINAGGFGLAMAGYVALAVGLVLARPGGSGRIAPMFPALIGLAWTAFLVTGLLDLLGRSAPPIDVVGPIGGLAQVIGLVGLGIATAQAQRWSGWRRWWPLGLATVFVGALFVPAVIGFEPAAVTETIWALGYGGLGLALLTEASLPEPRRRIRTVAVAALVLVAAGTAVTVMGPLASRAAAHRSAPAVHRSGGTVQPREPVGSPNLLEHNSSSGAVRPGVPTDGSANLLEHDAH
jgi:hypothetical protein